MPGTYTMELKLLEALGNVIGGIANYKTIKMLDVVVHSVGSSAVVRLGEILGGYGVAMFENPLPMPISVSIPWTPSKGYSGSIPVKGFYCVLLQDGTKLDGLMREILGMVLSLAGRVLQLPTAQRPLLYLCLQTQDCLDLTACRPYSSLYVAFRKPGGSLMSL